jgi:protein O-GlcNAc transferase
MPTTPVELPPQLVPTAEHAFRSALALHREGRANEADTLCDAILRAAPRHHAACHLRGLIALKCGDVDRGIALIEQSLAIEPDQPAAHCNIGNARLGQGRALEALARFDEALRQRPGYVAASYNRANALKDLGRLEEALAGYDAVLTLQSEHVPALNNRGLVLAELARFVEARDAFARAIELDPGFASAHANVAAVLLRLHHPLEALQSLERVLALAPTNLDALCQRARACSALQRQEQALESYQRALGVAPDLLPALRGAAGVALELGRAALALEYYERARRLAPLEPDALFGRAVALSKLLRVEAAAEGFEAVLAVAPHHGAAIESLWQLRLDRCDWRDYEALTRQTETALREGRSLVSPLSLMLLDSPELNLSCARTLVQHRYPAQSERPRNAPTDVGKLRVAYVSADFRDHPVAHLLAGVLEHHDRQCFEVIGISLRDGDGTAIADRVRGAFDRCVEVSGYSDADAAKLMRDWQVDIAVDLMGLTEGARLGIFARRPATTQVTYLGYPGTVGAPFLDYLIADAEVVRAGEETSYDERVVRLPYCYLPTDDRRATDALPTRVEHGLPPQGMIFCAFARAHKILPPVFEVWMQLLRGIESSVLWLRDPGAAAREHLASEARRRGVSPERLLFAANVASGAAHLARCALADLHLDTLPYSGHSTTCDALWAGVPVLTCTGRTAASRGAASALLAAGLPELVTHSLDDYARVALQLAHEPEQLRALRRRLEQDRRVSRLFDTAHYTQALEAAYIAMHTRARRGEAPAAITIDPDLRPRI